MLLLLLMINTVATTCILRDLVKSNIRTTRLEQRMSSYEKRTNDALSNWDEMRKTQSTLIKLYEEER